jgi:hypothetical protein
MRTLFQGAQADFLKKYLNIWVTNPGFFRAATPPIGISGAESCAASIGAIGTENTG